MSRGDHRWTDRIRSHRGGDRAASRSLLDDSRRAVRRVSGRYPAVYFELAEHSDESVDSLGNRVFTRLDGRVFGRFPFSGRAPFDAYTEEGFVDGDVLWHSFESRLSVTREALREQYNFNVRHHPEWAAKEQVHREVVAALKETGRPFPGRSPKYPRYGLPSWAAGPRRQKASWDRGDTVRQLTRRAHWPVASLVELVLARHGAPMYPGAISSIIQEATLRSEEPDREIEQLPSTVGTGAPTPAADSPRLHVRQRIATRWRALADEDRALLVLLLAGLPYREVVERLPNLNDPSAVTRGLKRLCDRFLADLVAAFSADRTDRAQGADGGVVGDGGAAAGGTGAGQSAAAALPKLRPQQVAELLFAVLIELPEVRAELSRNRSDHV